MASTENTNHPPSLGLLLLADFPLQELARLASLAEQLAYQKIWYTEYLDVVAGPGTFGAQELCGST